MALRAGPGRNLRSAGALAATVLLGAAVPASGQTPLPSVDPAVLAADPSAATGRPGTIAGGAAGPTDRAAEAVNPRAGAGGATSPTAGGALAPSTGSGRGARSGRGSHRTARPSEGLRRATGSSAGGAGAARSGGAARDAAVRPTAADRAAAAARRSAAARRAAAGRAEARRASRRASRQRDSGAEGRRTPSPARLPDRPAAGPANRDAALRAAAGALALVALSSLVLLRTVAHLRGEARVQ